MHRRFHISVILLIMIIIGCNGVDAIKPINTMPNMIQINLVNMSNSIVYKSNDDSLAVIGDKVYYCHKLDESSEPRIQIVYCDNGKTAVIFEGHIFDVHAYEHWLYYNDWDYSDHSTLWRVDLLSGKVEKILDDMYKYVICPAGIFWVNNSAKSIMYTNHDGSNVRTIFELNEKDTHFIGELSLFQQSLYFITVVTETPKYASEYYRLDLTTGIIEKPVQLNIQKSQDDTNHMSKIVHKVIGTDQIKLWLYEVPGTLFAANNGWLYYQAGLVWYDPETTLFEASDKPGSIYKIREDGTQKTKLFTKAEFVDYFAVQDGWIYYFKSSNNGNSIYRMKEDGSETQNVVETPCKFKDYIKGYVYYSLLFDEKGKRVPDNLYRINLNTLGKPERLY